MIKELPKYSVVHKEKNKLVLNLFFAKDYKYFEGHYPDFPLLPGMIQTHLAISFAVSELAIKGEFKGAKSIKYAQPIRPESNIDLEISFNEDKKELNFKYLSNENSFYSKGLIEFT